MFTQLKILLPRAARRLNVNRQILAAEVLHHYQKVVGSLISNPDILANTWPKWFKDKVLIIGVSNPAYAEELFIHKKEIIAQINKLLGSEEVFDLKTIVGEKEFRLN